MTAQLLPHDTKRLLFRCWREDDVPLAEGLWGNPEVTKFISRLPFELHQVEQRLSTEIASWNLHGLQYWPIFLKDSGRHVGCCGLRPSALAQSANPEKLPELGFHLLPGFWGQGFATEAARSAIDFAFERFKAKVLFAGHHPENIGSQRVLEKLGFQFTGTALYPPTGLQHRSYRLSVEMTI